jgi:large subunit ribosomal protein L24
MQKVIRRTILAEKQAARRLGKKKDKAAFEKRKSAREQVGFFTRDQVKDIRNAKKAQWEDYTLGPLAPKRDAGLAKDTYGTINGQRLKGPDLEGPKRREATKQVGGKYMNIVTGDRVVILKGIDKGKIGIIHSTNLKAGECTVKGLNMVSFSTHNCCLPVVRLS